MDINNENKFYRTIYNIFARPFVWLFNLKIVGAENIPTDGNYIIAANHRCALDPICICVCTKRVIRYLSKDELLDGPFGWFFRAAGCIKVNRGAKANNAECITEAESVLKNKGLVGIFPEGHRNRTEAQLLPFKFGAVKMAYETGSQIIPVGISGSYRVRSRDLTVRIGQPITVQGPQLEPSNEELKQKISDLLSQPSDKTGC